MKYDIHISVCLSMAKETHYPYYTCTHIHVHVHTHTRQHTHTHVYMHMHHTNTHTHMHMYITHMYIPYMTCYTHTHVHVNTNTTHTSHSYLYSRGHSPLSRYLHHNALPRLSCNHRPANTQYISSRLICSVETLSSSLKAFALSPSKIHKTRHNKLTNEQHKHYKVKSTNNRANYVYYMRRFNPRLIK